MYYTELVGDAKKLPTLKATAGFVGIAVIDADPYLSGGANMYVNQVGVVCLSDIPISCTDPSVEQLL